MTPQPHTLSPLFEFYRENWLDLRRRTISQLPPELQIIGYGLLKLNASGESIQDYQLANGTQRRAAYAFAQLSAAQREQVLTAVLPQYAPYAHAAWELQRQLPYQIYPRRAFRAPQRSSAALDRQTYWLNRVAHFLNGYDLTVSQLALLAGHEPQLQWAAEEVGLLLATAIDSGGEVGEQVFDTLVNIALDREPAGQFGRYIIIALLTASRPRGWEVVEQLLLAAQREEGLRQAIVEYIDLAHPTAFRRMVQLIVEHNLVRFNSIVRAVDVWFDFGFTVEDTGSVRRILSEFNTFLQDQTACAAALSGDDPQGIYLALCAQGFQDIDPVVPQAARLCQHDKREIRFMASRFLSRVRESAADEVLLPIVADPDLHLAVTALEGFNGRVYHPALFAQLETAVPHFPPQPKTLPALVWPWLTPKVDRSQIGRLMVQTGIRPSERLLPYLSIMDSVTRRQTLEALQKTGFGSPESRQALLDMLGDKSRDVRASAFQYVQELRLSPGEAATLEEFLTRKAADLRRGVLQILLNQTDKDALASADRLLKSAHELQRQAGLELLREMMWADRQVKECQQRLGIVQAGDVGSSRSEKAAAQTILAQPAELPTLDNGLGLFDPANLTRPQTPKTHNEISHSSKFWQRKKQNTAVAILESLRDTIAPYAETPAHYTTFWGQEKDELLGMLSGSLGVMDRRNTDAGKVVLPFSEVWRTWWETSPFRDDGGFGLLQTLAAIWHWGYLGIEYRWQTELNKELFGDVYAASKNYSAFLLREIIGWLILQYPPPDAVSYLLDATEHTFVLLKQRGVERGNWPQAHSSGWGGVIEWYRAVLPGEWADADYVRYFRLLLWFAKQDGERFTEYGHFRPPLDILIHAYHAGGATDADVIDHLIGQRIVTNYGNAFHDLRQVSGRKPQPTPLFQSIPDQALQANVQRIRERILEIELRRGEMPTAASDPALALRYAGDGRTLLALLTALGKESVARGWTWTSDRTSKQYVYSHLIRTTFPGEADTPEAFSAQAKPLKLTPKRWVEIAFFVPQWAQHIETVLGWPLFAEAIWWFHAHTKDQSWHVDQELRAQWASEISQRTPLTANELLEGAVDVAWFWRVYDEIGDERWWLLDNAAKYASGGNGHVRARLFANAMLGRVEQAELSSRMLQKRYQDGARALGLLPLPAGDGRESELLSRYLTLQEFVRTGRKFGSQRRANEKLAAQIGMENLARTAGYADPQRLEWAMEREAVADLANGPVAVTVEDVTVTLSIDFLSQPQIEVERNGRPLKSLPPKLKKNPDIQTLTDRKQAIKRQATRMRQSLEQAMCRGDWFTAVELQSMLTHPVLKPMLMDLLFIGEELIGFPTANGLQLEGMAGHMQVIPDNARLRLVHPYDLWQTGEWHRWQHDCFRRERIQPFKQLFRELYVLTPAERDTRLFSLRYAGQQVQPRQAVALLGARNWVVHYEEGVTRTFHEAQITATFTVDVGFLTPADVGLTTLNQVIFTWRGEWQALPLETIPPRIFSEVMRDLDLVVSVAHAGGVDPEATASTTEMRGNLVRETADLLKLSNVQVIEKLVLIEGKLNNYSIHLGSGVVHQRPGNYVCIVPVHAQQRGRIFLPFVDDDPKTAEIIAKMILLARDDKIKDPTILQQIRR